MLFLRSQRRLQPLYIVAITAICLTFAYHRSLGSEEIFRLQLSEQNLGLSLLSALHGKLTPYSPGEALLNWLSRQFFKNLLPTELWTRLPGIVWAIGAFWISCQLTRTKTYRFFPWLIFFSVTFLTVSVQMLSYASLLFSGALATYLIISAGSPTQPSPKDVTDFSERWPRVLTWFALLFGPLFGIFLVATASLLTRRWVRAIFGFSFVGILSYFAYASEGLLAGGGNSIPPLSLRMLSFIVLALTNPHYAGAVFCPLALVGVIVSFRTLRTTAWKLLLILLAGVALPIFFERFTQISFAPRDVIAGVFPFTAFCLQGLTWVENQFTVSKRSKNLLLGFIFIFNLLSPWVFAVVYHFPPFPDRPMNLFREVVTGFKKEGAKSVFMLNPCDMPAVAHYANATYNTLPQDPIDLTLSGVSLVKTCWNSDLCIWMPKGDRYCTMKSMEFIVDPVIQMIDQNMKKFDLVFYEFPDYPAPNRVSMLKIIRGW